VQPDEAQDATTSQQATGLRHRHPREPDAQRPGLAELVEAGEREGEGLLHDVFCVLLPAAEPQRDGAEVAHVPTVDGLLRAGITRPRPEHQLGVVDEGTRRARGPRRRRRDGGIHRETFMLQRHEHPSPA
jgi:hypothetical protein